MPLLRCCVPYKYGSRCCSSPTSPPPSPSPYPSSVSFAPLPPRHIPGRRPLRPLFSLQSETPDDDDNDTGRSNRGHGIPPRSREPRPVLVERRRDGTAKRLVPEDDIYQSLDMRESEYMPWTGNSTRKVGKKGGRERIETTRGGITNPSALAENTRIHS